jgi:hypothetical protein
MFAKRALMGLAAGCAALGAAFGLAPAPAEADEARMTVTPAVYRVNEAGGSGATIELVRHHGYHGGGRGWGWGGGYRGYGYRYGGHYRPYAVRPFYGVYYGVGPGYGYGAPGYGYGVYGGGRSW